MILYNPPTGKNISLDGFYFGTDSYKKVGLEDARYLIKKHPFLINMSSKKRKPSYCDVVTQSPRRFRRIRRLFLKLKNGILEKSKGRHTS